MYCRRKTKVCGLSHWGTSAGMNGTESALLADDAGLRYIESGDPGYRRVRRGRGFSYLTETGQTVNGELRDWIESLAIPPAWEDVWVSADARGHILATGHDNAGRKQYVYHPLWEEARDEVKFDRLGEFGGEIVRLRQCIDSDLQRRGLPRRKVVALAVAVLDKTLARVGNRRYAIENESYGLTTLTCEHLEVDGRHVHIEFEGKGGADHQLVFADRRIAELVSRCQDLDGQTLFSYETTDGGSASISSSDINSYLSEELGGPFTSKDFRSWGASSLVMGALGRSSVVDPVLRVREAIEAAAERLGNSAEVCRSAYVHPLVIEADSDGRLQDAWGRSRPGKWIDREESAVRLLLKSEQA